MRELKFRTWVFKEGKMINSQYSALAVKTFTPNYAYLAKEVEVMQYTGLKDKNMNDIYENDILDDGFGIGIVEFVRGAFRVNYKTGKAKWFIDYLPSEEKFVEVIGNIYENPELISK